MEQRASRVGILVFDDVEVLDFCGPFEVFSVAREAGEQDDGGRLFEVVTISEEDRIVNCRGGLMVKPHFTTRSHPPLDILVIPRGAGTRRERHNNKLLDWISAQHRQTRVTASVCTGAFLLAERGLLDGKRATTHHNSVEWMRGQYPEVQMLSDTRVVDEGRIITSAGISAGIDMSLRLVGRLHGPEVAAWTARMMEYESPEPSHSSPTRTKDSAR